MSASPQPSRALAGVVLCGGRSARMGRDKARLPVGGEPSQPLVMHVAARLGRVANPVLLAPGRPGRLGPLPYREVEDDEAGTGPLGGLAAALGASPHPVVAAVAVDMPFASPDLLGLLCDLRHGEDVVVPETSDGLQPLHAVYSTECLPVLRRALATGQLAVHAVLPGLSVRVVREDEWRQADPRGRFALNLNWPGDLRVLTTDLPR